MNWRDRRAAERSHGQVLALEPEKAMCARHRALFDDHPPAVKLAALGGLLADFVSDPRIQAETNGGHILQVGPSVEKHQPLCCFLGDAHMARLQVTAIEQGT